MARTANTDLVQQGEAEATPVSRTRRVIIQRPYGNTDTHIHLGLIFLLTWLITCANKNALSSMRMKPVRL
jgi:hypothetical protein